MSTLAIVGTSKCCTDMLGRRRPDVHAPEGADGTGVPPNRVQENRGVGGAVHAVRGPGSGEALPEHLRHGRGPGWLPDESEL
jgi:hypothetical protein